MYGIIVVLEKYRSLLSAVFLGSLFGVYIFSDRSLDVPSIYMTIMDGVALMFVVVCTLGRLWSLVFIAGYKEHVVIRYGPYSIVRHPLYLFSFIGAMGIGMVSGSIVLLISMVLWYVFYYPVVIRREEDRMYDKHGEEYKEYISSIPRVLSEETAIICPEEYRINTKIYRRGFLDAMGFFAVFVLLEIVKDLHASHLLPVFFRLP